MGKFKRWKKKMLWKGLQIISKMKWESWAGGGGKEGRKHEKKRPKDDDKEHE